MTDSRNILTRAEALVRASETRDPDVIARDLGVRVYDNLEAPSLLGMYCCRWRTRFVLLNSRLDSRTRRIVLAHELGHDQQHRALARAGGLQEFSLFNMRSRTEYEANAFAAHLLLDTEEFLACVREGWDTVQTASRLDTNINLVLIKAAELNHLGWDLRMPEEPDSCFLKKTDPN